MNQQRSTINDQRIITAVELAKEISGQLAGDPAQTVYSLGTIEDAGPGQAAFLLDIKNKQQAAGSKASILIVPQEYDNPGQTLIRVASPRAVMPRVLGLFAPVDSVLYGVHKTAVVPGSAKINGKVSIGPNVVIGEYVEIGEGTVVNANVNIGPYVSIGANCLIYPGVSIYHRCVLKNNIIVHSNAVIGSDGFGYFPAKDKSWQKIPQIGRVVLEDNVEIGACTCIDRGTIGDTVVGEGTKIDNLCHIAHNCKFGKSCASAALVAYAGSTVFGDNVMIGGQAGFAGHLEVGSGTTIMARAGVTKDIAGGQIVSGFPARPHREDLKHESMLRRLPAIIEKVNKLFKNNEQ